MVSNYCNGEKRKLAFILKCPFLLARRSPGGRLRTPWNRVPRYIMAPGDPDYQLHEPANHRATVAPIHNHVALAIALCAVLAPCVWLSLSIALLPVHP
jgi:hypothetical protein